MAASKLNLPVIEKGATYRHTLYWKNSSNVPIDLTDCTAKLQARPSIESNIILLELSTANTGLVITPLLGKIDLYINSLTTTNLVGNLGLYDLEVYFPNNDIVRLIEGRVSFKDEITRL